MLTSKWKGEWGYLRCDGKILYQARPCQGAYASRQTKNRVFDISTDLIISVAVLKIFKMKVGAAYSRNLREESAIAKSNTRRAGWCQTLFHREHGVRTYW
jgi:hypothetical protein